MMNFTKTYLSILLLCLTALYANAQNTISIDLKQQKFVGDVSELDRGKYFNIHHTYMSWELNPVGDELFDNLGIGLGRQFAGPGTGNPNKSNGIITAFPTAAEGTTIGNNKRTTWDDNPDYFKRLTNEMIITDHPGDAFLLNGDYNKAADYTVNYFKAAYSNGMPKYYEMMNEPFVHTYDFSSNSTEVIADMTEQWKTVADKIHQEIPEMKVGGYASAWPEMEKNDFDHFNDRMKYFMDNAGASVDFFSTHLYDGANVEGDDQNRSGSNSEAIMDLIEAYSYSKWGTVKPHVISEYGKTVKTWTKDSNGNKDPKPYSAERDGEILKSINAFLFQFMQKPDRILKTIPFITAKSNFYYSQSSNTNDYPYPWVILKKEADGSFTYTHLKKFYELWKDVKGKRVYTASTDPDLRSNVFVDGNKAYIALYNMEGSTKTVNLDMLNNSGSTITSVTTRRLYTDGSDIPQLTETTASNLPASVSLNSQETVVLVCSMSSNLAFNSTIREKNYHSGKVLQNITANNTITYTFNNVTAGSGTASLRLGIGRAHGLSLAPEVKVNGTVVSVPTDWIGYNQYNRDQFFGMIDVPFDTSLLQAGTNTVTVKFSDNGGRVSSVIMNTAIIDGTEVEPNADEVKLTQAPTSITPQTSYTINVEYTAGTDRELVLEFWKGGTWINSKIETVTAGSGVKAMTVNMSAAPAVGTDYIWKAQIRPIGSSWQDATDTDQVDNVEVANNLQDVVSLAQAATSLTPQTSYTVNMEYTASADRELVLELWDGNTWLTSKVHTVATGTGVETMTVTLATAPATGTNYVWKAQIRPVGSSWQDATDTDRIDNVEVINNVQDAVSLVQAPTSLTPATSYTVNVEYTASAERELILEFWNGTTWLKDKKHTIAAGTGVETMTVTLATAPADGSNYVWKAQIRPVGSSWQDATDNDQVNNVVVTTPTPTVDIISLEQAPTTVTSATSYTVNLVYEATTDRDISIAFWNGNTWLASDIVTVSAGTGIASMNINLSSAPAAGSNYKWKADIRPVGAGWQDATDNDQIDNVIVNASGARFGVNEKTEIQALRLEVYPNPSPNGIFRLAFNQNIDNATVEVFNMSGKRLMLKNIKGKQNIDLSNLQDKGLFLMRIYANGQVFNKKVLFK